MNNLHVVNSSGINDPWVLQFSLVLRRAVEKEVPFWY